MREGRQLKEINYRELLDFVNFIDVNIKGKTVRVGLVELNLDNYSTTRHGAIRGNLDALRDIALMSESILDYPLGSGVKVMMFNLIMQAKALIVDNRPEQITEVSFHESELGELSIHLDIKEDLNKYSRISLSSFRTFELTGEPSELTQTVAAQIKLKFKMLSELRI